MNLRISLWFGCCLFFTCVCHSQQATINWLDFEQLEDSLAIKPKKVFIDFYADWCAYCKKMDRAAFRDEGVVAQLSSNYYAVKMNVESKDTIYFGGDTFYNRELGKKRNPTHEIPLLLASREGSPFSLPAIVILDEKFQMSERHFEYIPPKVMLEILAD
ncbi:thioredoxin family protein [Muricauda sp. SCSIO 64092]|uniref:thioredoxin family protein n=1 Tax=Allomuricauda sp. SCSIO 64092 TaxID=2908842 RepID=UPI001FF224C2|nr:thioredoxin family protein [Muricauda sp. SCSIO 64092]UOY07571.1 thioredoxin family protein [Muricauda sp. SCSIO 64092]